jgi:hypothetical protein
LTIWLSGIAAEGWSLRRHSGEPAPTRPCEFARTLRPDASAGSNNDDAIGGKSCHSDLHMHRLRVKRGPH